MSLINSMLRDLDKRRAGDEARKGLPSVVRPLPVAKTGVTPALMSVLGLVVIAIAVAAWWYSQPVVVVPVPVVSVPSSPPPPPPAPPAQIDPVEPIALPPTPPEPTATPPEPIPTPPAVETQIPTSEKPLAQLLPSITLGTLRLDARLKTAPIPKPAAEPDVAPKHVNKPAAAPVAVAPAREEDDWQRAQALLRENRPDQAEPLLARVLQNQASNTAARQALLGILLTAGRHGEAADLMRRGLVQAPEQTGWAMNLARLYVEKNDYTAAWEVLAKSAAHAQQNPEFLAFCGTVLQRLNRSAEALPYYRNALQLKPREGRWWVGYGIALESDGKAADARESYQRARTLGELPPEVTSFVEQKLR